MWTIINLVFLFLGSASTFYGWKEGQQSEAYHAFLPFFGGILLIVAVGLSAAVKAIWF